MLLKEITKQNKTKQKTKQKQKNTKYVSKLEVAKKEKTMEEMKIVFPKLA